ncbi:alanine racemase [Billgrantia endophytica]|uniref:Diaminopimelate decarboxylase n=1 Tax=Billgrantia endophytica TaxID=2033802 RepID=A0A2N7UEA3_9GAMM|nr:alanine racemase [Halomonas endophytica]PMR78721.1 diaminopimelate decarboxylase [Halomonas endophytica]
MDNKIVPNHVLLAIDRIRARFETPFFLYNAASIRTQYTMLVSAFDGLPFQQYFAVKALPNPTILRMLLDMGAGFDCATMTEVQMVRALGAEKLVFTSSNSSIEQFAIAEAEGARLTIDDLHLLERLPRRATQTSLRINFGNSCSDNIIGGARSKFGMTPDQARQAAMQLKANGITSIGLHCMDSANHTDSTKKTREAIDLITFARQLVDEGGVDISSLNFGGGLGIPYRPNDTAFDVTDYALKIRAALTKYFYVIPDLSMECGRFITGPSGYLVTEVTGVYRKPHSVIGLNVSTAAMPRVSIYPNAYHHVSLPGAAGTELIPTDVVGSMCESMDKFCEARPLPMPHQGDLCLIHDVGAHCISMSNNYNGMLRPPEFLMDNSSIYMISRAESFQDVTSRFINMEVKENDKIVEKA